MLYTRVYREIYDLGKILMLGLGACGKGRRQRASPAAAAASRTEARPSPAAVLHHDGVLLTCVSAVSTLFSLLQTSR